MASISHLIRRGSAYSARIRVPLDLVGIIGKREMVRALGTTDHAEAKRRLYPVIAGLQREFEDLRARRALVPTDREQAVWDQYTATMARDDQARANLPGETEVEAAKADLFAKVERGEFASADPLDVLDATLELKVTQNAGAIAAEQRQIKVAELRKHLAKGETALIAHEVDAYLQRNGLHINRGTPDWIGLAQHMIRAEIEALQRTLERDRGDYSGQPGDPLVKPASGSGREVAKPGQSIMEIFGIFSRENPNGVSKDRLNQSRRDICTFVEVVGTSFPIAKITKAEVREWKHLLSKYPVKATETKLFAGMNIRQIVKANEGEGKPVLADRTVNRYLSSLGAFLTWAVDNGYLPQNPTERMSLKKEVKTATLPFNVEQMNTLFASPLFTGCMGADEWRNVAKPGNVQIRDHRFWVPLIMLFSGARVGEIGQLAVADIRQEHGTWIFHITNEGDDTAEGKSLKTAGSMRVVPVHPELIRLGLLRYHEQRLKDGGTALFPGAKRNERGQMLFDLSREFGRYMTRIGLKQGRGLSLYSFRHGATDALRRAGFLDAQIGIILGHGEPTMTGKYGIIPQGPLQQRVELIESISYPGLKLDHLIDQNI